MSSARRRPGCGCRCIRRRARGPPSWRRPMRSGEDINEAVREGLRDEGALHGRVLETLRLVGLGLTRAQKADTANYRPGDVLVFHNDIYPYRVKADDACTVTGDGREGPGIAAPSRRAPAPDRPLGPGPLPLRALRDAPDPPPGGRPHPLDAQ